jgi:hypothetical protein
MLQHQSAGATFMGDEDELGISTTSGCRSMRPDRRTILSWLTGLLVVTAIGLFFLAGWFDQQKHVLSGVPTSHFAINENGRHFYVPRGGPPVEQRPHVALTTEEYRLYEENEELGSQWAGRAALCFLLAMGVAIYLKLTETSRVGS